MTEKVLVSDGHGGYKQIDAVKVSNGSQANAEKQTKVLMEAAVKASHERIGLAAEAFNKMHKAYATDYALEVDELIKAMYLEILNWKEFFPKDLGGPAQFDVYCKEIYDWFVMNKDKT